MRQIPYGRQSIDDTDLRAVRRALRSDFLTQGPKIPEFEAAVAKACGAKYAVACCNGTAALHLACLAAGLGPGDEAIVPPITFAATGNAVLYCGAKPVFADVQSDTINLDPVAAARAVTRKTKAILPVHFGGLPADMAEIGALARRKGLLVIEDAAHALGAEYRGHPVGACRHSDMAVLSFHPVKHITTGEGGMVLTNRAELRDRLMLYRSHGITRDPALLGRSDGPWYYEMQALGFNYRITDLQCALGLAQLKKLPRFVARRRMIAAEYEKEFSAIPQLRLIHEKPDRRNAFHLYVLQLRDQSRRRSFFEFLRSKGVQANVHYIPLHSMPYYRAHGYARVKMPRAEDYYKGAVSIPLHPGLLRSEIKRVIAAVKAGV